MPKSPSKRERIPSDDYKPKITRTCGQRPACLVNASVTYCGNDQIYAFGGFDQYTDEGGVQFIDYLRWLRITLTLDSVQSCASLGS